MTEQASSSFTRALGLILSAVEMRMCAEAYGEGGKLPYASLAQADFRAGYEIMDEALALT